MSEEAFPFNVAAMADALTHACTCPACALMRRTFPKVLDAVAVVRNGMADLPPPATDPDVVLAPVPEAPVVALAVALMAVRDVPLEVVFAAVQRGYEMGLEAVADDGDPTPRHHHEAGHA